MKSTTTAKPQCDTVGLSTETTDLLKRLAERHAKFSRMSKARQRAELIRRLTLTPEGKLPVYPMDHVLLGPRE